MDSGIIFPISALLRVRTYRRVYPCTHGKHLGMFRKLGGPETGKENPTGWPYQVHLLLRLEGPLSPLSPLPWTSRLCYLQVLEGKTSPTEAQVMC